MVKCSEQQFLKYLICILIYAYCVTFCHRLFTYEIIIVAQYMPNAAFLLFHLCCSLTSLKHLGMVMDSIVQCEYEDDKHFRLFIKAVYCRRNLTFGICLAFFWCGQRCRYSKLRTPRKATAFSVYMCM